MSALFQVKLFLTAKSKEELVVKQIEQNIKDKITHNYEIIKDGKNWTAWYLADATKLVKKDLELRIEEDIKVDNGVKED